MAVQGPGDPANGIYSFNDLIKEQPSDRLVSGRQISADEIAAYFHTGAPPARRNWFVTPTAIRSTRLGPSI